MNEKVPLEERRRRALRGIGPFVIFTACFAIVASFFFYRTFVGVRQNANDPVAACEGLPVSGVATYQEGPGTKLAIAYRQIENGQYVADNELLLPEWRADTTGELEVVVCLGRQEALTIPECSSGTETAYGYQLEIRVINAGAGTTIAQELLQTAELDEESCRDAQTLGQARRVSDGEILNFLIPLLDSR